MKYIFLIFILVMAPNSHHLIQISIVEEYRIFRTINLDKNDDFVYNGFKKNLSNKYLPKQRYHDV
jgi:hypothetical protein